MEFEYRILMFFRKIKIMAPSYYLGDIVCLCEDRHGTVLPGFISLSLWFNKHSLHLFVSFSNSTNKSSEVDFWWNVPWFQFIFPPLKDSSLGTGHGVMVCCRRVMSWCQAAIFPSKGRRNSWADSWADSEWGCWLQRVHLHEDLSNDIRNVGFT